MQFFGYQKHYLMGLLQKILGSKSRLIFQRVILVTSGVSMDFHPPHTLQFKNQVYNLKTLYLKKQVYRKKSQTLSPAVSYSLHTETFHFHPTERFIKNEEVTKPLKSRRAETPRNPKVPSPKLQKQQRVAEKRTLICRQVQGATGRQLVSYHVTPESERGGLLVMQLFFLIGKFSDRSEEDRDGPVSLILEEAYVKIERCDPQL